MPEWQNARPSSVTKSTINITGNHHVRRSIVGLTVSIENS